LHNARELAQQAARSFFLRATLTRQAIAEQRNARAQLTETP